MKTELLDYLLPEDRIATHPLEDRSASRLLVVGRTENRHGSFREFPELVPEGALVVLNDTRVLRARLLGHKRGTGGAVEIFLVRKLRADSDADETWLALGRSSKPLRPGTEIDLGPLSATVLAREEDALLRVRLVAGEPVSRAVERSGRVPLPPYMRRADEPADAQRYQTVFAREDGSVAAPTAGLHVTDETLARLRARGVEIAFTTLHVGLGTFRPVTVEDLDEHPMHEEDLVVSEELAAAVSRTRERGGSVVAVGTTVVRALESARDSRDPRRVLPGARSTRLLIQPGYEFGPVDALLTNFHMPKSTLLALVYAFAGSERAARAYAEALREGYRFLSYGDAMWIPERAS
ncbi:MAG TPA: tRNA preQ1(34) S-adenosylmethionine ribosyltransferase-isomerase QueA [Polyangiaceae bacterium]|nr:tRNA preQ1(34) S-adenosylmethionine ribosyltransferase-isomerase QueA [Polyangiaceae bacterium]